MKSAAAVIGLLMLSCAGARELITNPHFGTDTSGWAVHFGDGLSHAAGDGHVTADGAGRVEGHIDSFAGISQCVDVSGPSRPGELRVAASLKPPAATTFAGVIIDFFSDPLCTRANGARQLPAVLPGGQWSRVTASFQSPPGTRGLRVVVFATDVPEGGETLFDDVSLTEMPGATLLIPYFEVSSAHGVACGQSRTTRVGLTNTATTAALAKATVWSDLGVAIIDFPIYFHPLTDVEFDLGEMVCQGNLPVTGPTEPPGSAGSPGDQFPQCDASLPFVNPALSSAFLARLRDGSTGQPNSFGECAGSATGDDVARGYVTIDLVNQCDTLFPSNPGADAILVGEDWLAGTVTYEGLDGSYDFEVPAVAVKAGSFGSGDHTFYGRYDGGSPTGEDGRAPLPGRFLSPLVTGAAGTTRLVYWREGPGSADFFDCATPPANLSGLADNVLMFDASGAPGIATVAPPLQAGIFSWVGIPGTPDLGVADIDLRHGDIAYPDPDVMAQAWVITINDPAVGPPRVDRGTESTGIFRSGFEGPIEP